MLNLTALRSFHEVARGGGVQTAAQQLNVTPGAVRHQIRQLEQELGEELVVRSKRTLALTPQGQRLYDRLNHAFREMENACRSLSVRDGMEGELRIACAPALAASRLTGLIKAYCQRFPLMTVRLFSIDRADESMDIIISYGERPIPGARASILRDESYFPVCSPELKYESEIRTVRDLARCVGLHADAGGDWMRVLSMVSSQDVRFSQQIYFPNAAASLLAAREGCGVAVGTSILCAEDLRRGVLVRLLDIEVPAPSPYFVIQPAPLLKASSEQFVEMLLEYIEKA